MYEPGMSYRIFLSHYSGDQAIANALCELVDHAFAGHVEPFISSAIPIGKNWLAQVKDALAVSDEILTIFTHRSAERPWLNIETGYGIMAERPVTPVLFSGFTASDLSIVYQLQLAVDERADDSVRKLFSSISDRLKAKNPRARSVISADQFLAEWRSKVSAAAAATPSQGSRPRDSPLLWVIGSHDGLSPREQTESLAVIRTIAHVSFQNRIRLVFGVSRLLEYLADSHEALAAQGAVFAGASGEPWRKVIGAAHVEMKGRAYNPVILAGTLRTPDLRQRFDDALGRVPDLAIVVGGRSKANGGRTYEECAAAIAAGIPLLPISFTGGAASEVTPSIGPKATALLPAVLASQGKLDVFADTLIRLIRAQFGSG
jgi:hypothetical protein